jgi:hypothetical protein
LPQDSGHHLLFQGFDGHCRLALHHRRGERYALAIGRKALALDQMVDMKP